MTEKTYNKDIFFAAFASFVLVVSIFSITFSLTRKNEVKTGLGALLGDVNNDGRVDILDFQLLSNSFGKAQGQSGYNSSADFNIDGRVDILDFQLLSNNFGQSGGTPTPTSPPPNPGFQPSAPFYTTFFYPWTENPNIDGRWSYWNDRGNNPPNTWFSHFIPDVDSGRFDPATELYSSKNDAVLNWQLGKLKEAKIEVAVSSWWGRGHKTDAAFSKIVRDTMNREGNPYPNLRWAIYYEKEGFGDPPLDGELVPDLVHVVQNYTNQRGYFKINGRPVVFVYNAAHSGSSAMGDLSRWQQAKARVRSQTGVDLYVVLKTDPLNAGASPTAIDSWHEYAPANRFQVRAPYWAYVSPGFWLDDGSGPRLVRNISEFRASVGSLVGANATWKMVQTWNEWGEGTSVEPGEQTMMSGGREVVDPNATQFKNIYIDILNAALPALE